MVFEKHVMCDTTKHKYNLRDTIVSEAVVVFIYLDIKENHHIQLDTHTVRVQSPVIHFALHPDRFFALL